MNKFLSIIAICCMLLSMSAVCPIVMGAELKLLTEVRSSGDVKILWFDGMEILDSSGNEIVFATQNQGSDCGWGTPVSAWKLILDPITGSVSSLGIKQSLEMIQTTRGSIFEGPDGTLFSGGGWCGYTPPYYSTDGGDSWQTADRGVHPPNSTYAFVEFNGSVYAGTGYEPWPAQVYRWLGDTGTDYWELVFEIPPPRSIINRRTMAVYEGRLFVGSIVYWSDPSGCKNSVPVYVSDDAVTFEPTTGIPHCYNVWAVLTVGDKLVALVRDNAEGTDLVYMYGWNKLTNRWEEIGPYPLEESGYASELLSHEGVLYGYGKAPGDSSKGVYKSADLGKTWKQVAALKNPDVHSMAIHDGVLYLGTSADANDTAFIYKLELAAQIEVKLDIKPGSYPNSINLWSKGKIPVAILTTHEFDAREVDPESCVFAGANPLRWRLEDVDRDGDKDLLFHFSTTELELTKDSTEATLEGETYDGIRITGTDSVKIVPKCKTHGKHDKDCKHGKEMKKHK